MAKAFVRNINDAEPACPPLHENTSSWALVTPKLGGSDDIEFFITEIRPGGAALKDIHVDADHVYFYISGKGYSIVEGERFEFGPNDALWIPRNSQHEMYCVGEETLRFAVLFAPARGIDQSVPRQTKAFVRNINDVNPVCPPLHENTSSWPLVTPKLGGGDSIEFFVTEIRPGGAALKDIHVDADHVYFYISGKGYSIVDGERFEFGPNDAFFIPRNSDHEMYVTGEEALRFIVLFAPCREAMRP